MLKMTIKIRNSHFCQNAFSLNINSKIDNSHLHIFFLILIIKIAHICCKVDISLSVE